MAPPPVIDDPTGAHALGHTALRSKAREGWHYTEIVGNATTHDSPTCIACHSAVKDQDYMFTLPQLLTYAKTGQVQMVVCNRLGRRPCGTQSK